MSAFMPDSSAADRDAPASPIRPSQTQGAAGEARDLPKHLACCHKGYKVLSLERPTVYCICPLGPLAKAMDEDPLDNAKAERWERACRYRGWA